jgi:ABC-type multidrug transport system fused ATPase/permease subunit
MVDAREVELQALYKRIFTLLLMMTIWLLTPILIMVVVFYVYTLDFVLTASTAFTALALFSILRGALVELPFIISIYVQAGVSLSRVENFLAEEEIEPVSQTAHPSGIYIGFVENATFGWDSPTSSSDEPILKNLNIAFPQHKLSIVCGPTASGKTTLLSSLLGETYCYNGSAVLPYRQLGGTGSGIAYVAQTAWLQNGSIRDNILFGLEFDEERYSKVLYMTALTKDLDILEFGDATEIGESGISLSGGQKQR